MLIYIKEKDEIFYIDYRSKSPRNASIEKLLGTKKVPETNSKRWERVDYTYLASAVPGTVYGLLEAHKNFGRLNLQEIMKPVIAQAEEGIVVSSDLSYVIDVTPQLKSDKESYSIYFKDNKPLKEFSIMKRPDLANTFKEISKNGIKGFYEGEIADKIVNAMNQNNGLITHEDLKNYKSFFRMPIAINYKGHKVFTAAPPSGGGITLLTSLKSDYLNAEYLFEEIEIDTSTKTEDDSSALPTNPFELVEMIRRQNSMNDATDPSDAIDDALKSFNSLEENQEI